MQEDLQDPRSILLSNIDSAKSRVELSDTPIVLLCGGSVAPLKVNPDDDDPPIASLRDAISRTNTAYEIFRPEEITSWQADGVFKNLMTFEADLASICSLVVIVLESPGSLAELGAFSQLPDLSKKIIVIRSSDFQDDTSFINLGILRYIAESHESSIKSYPWNILNPQSITEEMIDDVISDIKFELSELKKSEVFKPCQSSHIVVLICEIINYFTALKEHEIFEYLTIVGTKINKDELRCKLFLLEKFKLINKIGYSDSIFYMRSQEKYHRLRLTLKNEVYPDVLRFKVECIDYYKKYKDTKHRNRIRAIAQAERGLKK
jgi:hypothetical protein